MMKFGTLVVALGVAAPVFSGLIDHGDYTHFPNVNVDAHLVIVGKAHYPKEIYELPKGLSRPDAWRHDIAKAAEGLNIPADKLEKFINHVIRHDQTAPVAAPHEKLLEFELYARGRNELYFHASTDEMPPAWRQLLALPVEKRRYTTIPVLFVWNKFCSHRWKFGGDALEAIAAARSLGCIDTQGCERTLLCDEPEQVYLRRSFPVKIEEYKWLFRAYTLKCRPIKLWRYTNVMDGFSWASGRGDRFFSGTNMPDLRYSLYMEKGSTLREICRSSAVLRDLIVAVGLTNWQMTDLRKVALEFARESEVNYPVLALRLPPAEAEKLLAGRPEHARLLDLLKLKRLHGMAKVKAIDAYIAKYPDYTPKDMPVTSIALNTHGELQALAGLEFFKLGRYREALERWIVCGTPEDIGIVAEQIFTVDELAEFCRKHGMERNDDSYSVDSCQCANNNKLLYPTFVGRAEATCVLRNILARRLMRARRFEEARKWFTWEAACDMARFMEYRQVLLDPKAARADKLAAALSLGALIRFKGDRLFGTFLEPDNVICDGEYPCKWGTKLPGIKLNKPALPRFHYRWIAAEFYRRAAEYTDDPKLKGFCLWMAGTLLKNRDIKLADADFKKLFAIRPELTMNNWFKPLAKCGNDVKELYNRRFFITDPGKIGDFTPPLPEVRKVTLPANDGSAKALFRSGIGIVTEAVESPDPNRSMRQCIYAFYLAGEKGLAVGYAWCGIVYSEIGMDLYAIAFYRKALALDPGCNAARHELGRVYLDNGYWQEGLKLVRQVADNERSDRRLESLAAFNIGKIYTEGLYGVTPDEALAKRYLEQAEKLNPNLVGQYRVELKKKARAAEEKRALEEKRKAEKKRAAEEKKAKPAAKTETPKPAAKPAK